MKTTEVTVNNIPSEKEDTLFKKPIIWIPAALFSAFLWGSAFPAIKSGYLLFQVDTENVFSIIVFAGIRFTLAGILTLLIAVLLTKKMPTVEKLERNKIFLLAMLQTTIHYSFFYIALSNTSGVNGSILNATGGFISVIFAAIYYKDDRLTVGKVAGIFLGFTGVVLLNLGQGALSTNFALFGEGFMLIAAALSALAALVSKELAGKTHPFAVSGYQLLIGGAMLSLIGYLGGGKITPIGADSYLLMLYLSLISCFAFGIWTTLLKHHALSKISMFKSMIPVFGSFLSIVFLDEPMLLSAIFALFLIVIGIFVLNRWKTS